MKLKYLQGISRASLFLAEGYLSEHKDELEKPEVIFRCQRIISDYLNNNGLKFDFTNGRDNIIARRTYKVARKMIKENLEPLEAIEILGKRLRLKLD